MGSEKCRSQTLDPNPVRRDEKLAPSAHVEGCGPVMARPGTRRRKLTPHWEQPRPFQEASARTIESEPKEDARSEALQLWPSPWLSNPESRRSEDGKRLSAERQTTCRGKCTPKLIPICKTRDAVDANPRLPKCQL